MANNSKELPKDRLATTDTLGQRIYLHPAPVRGFFRKWRNVTEIILIAIFLLLPWVKVGGHQAVLLDLPNRQFALFGLTFWAHDAPMIFFVLGILVMSLAFVTAVWGRVWCGWACPQTVFIDGVFRRIEAFIEGNHLKRRKLDARPMDFDKFWRRTLKWGLFLVVSLVITHSFLAYFVGSDRVINMVQGAPSENWVSFLVILVTTSIILFDFGWFREQFCIIACPYGRFQSVLMSDQSQAILYDEKRGEPRKGTQPKGQAHGDCINCFKCVNVCPTGIDIRRGVQMECIACTACADACDEVMEKIGKPKGLIRYESETVLAGKPAKRFFQRPRVMIYLTLLVLMIIGLTFSVARRQDLHVSLVHPADVPYRVLDKEGGTILNHFKVHIKNQSFEERKIELKLTDDFASKGAQLVTQTNPFSIEAGEKADTHIFVKVPPELMQGRTKLNTKLLLRDLKKSKTMEQKLGLIGPRQKN